MRKITYQSAKVTCKRTASGVTEVVYSGLLTQAAFESLRAAVVYETTDDVALLIRMDMALLSIIHAPAVPLGVYRRNGTPAAIVVRPENYQMWVSYGRDLSAHGVMRAVFLTDELEQARAWAESAVCASTA